MSIKWTLYDNLEGVFISDERSIKEPYVIVAKRGNLIADPQSMNVTLAMQNGTILTQPHTEQAYSLMGFDAARLNLNISNALLQNNSPGKGPEDIETLELVQEIKRLPWKVSPYFAMKQNCTSACRSRLPAFSSA